jgi:nitrate reductase gamma subunit
MWSVGAPASATDRAGDRAKGMLRDAVAHVRILRDRVPGLMHLGIFLGFALPLLAALAALAGLRLPGFLAAAVSLLLDLAALGALAGVGYALVRRYALRPPRLDNRPDDLVVLLLIAGVLVAGFSTAALRVARTGEGPFPSPATWLFALPLGLLGPEAQGAVQPWVWKVHFLLVCAVIAACRPWSTSAGRTSWTSTPARAAAAARTAARRTSPRSPFRPRRRSRT